jgi:ADP-heptose:LPS heptosyltransferase
VSRVLAVRLDSDGDVLLAGPAIRAMAARADVDLLVSGSGAAAGRLLPAVGEVAVFDAPWTGFAPPRFDPDAVRQLVDHVRARNYAAAVIFTSFHQSPLPMALLARMAGVPLLAADCEDYPGALLDVRHRRGEVHEVVAALQLAEAAGFPRPAGDDGRPAVRATGLPGHLARLLPPSFVALHPGASVGSRALTGSHAAAIVAALCAAGHRVVVTGGPAERQLAAQAAGHLPGVLDLAGRTSFAELAAVLRRADALVVGNTGPAHLAAAVGTPVVSLFSPVVPAGRWAPYGVPSVLLGDQGAGCRDSRARECPLAGHPCLSGVHPGDVVDAVDQVRLQRPAAVGTEATRSRIPPVAPGKPVCESEGAR